jgi:hypothetical protein
VIFLNKLLISTPGPRPFHGFYFTKSVELLINFELILPVDSGYIALTFFCAYRNATRVLFMFGYQATNLQPSVIILYYSMIYVYA